MQRSFTKLFNTLVTSTIWQADDQTRIVWITMLALADREGNVWASVPGLANQANVPVAATERALAILKSPDKYSRTKAHEGRRIVEIEGGWHIHTYKAHREMMNAEERRQYKTAKQREYRERSSNGEVKV
jgi:hypothetical protein